MGFSALSPPMLLEPLSERPAIVFCGVSLLPLSPRRRRTAFSRLAAASNEAQLEEYAAVFRKHKEAVLDPITQYLNTV